MQSMTSLLLRSYWDQQHLVSNLLVFRPAENFVRQPPKSCAAEGDECTWDNILQGYRETKTSIKRSQTRTETFTSKLCKTTMTTLVIRNSEKINPNSEQPIRPIKVYTKDHQGTCQDFQSHHVQGPTGFCFWSPLHHVKLFLQQPETSSQTWKISRPRLMY